MRNPDQRSVLREHPIVWCVMIEVRLVPLAHTELTKADISMCELDGGVHSRVIFVMLLNFSCQI
jgi:hypothetical protein